MAANDSGVPPKLSASDRLPVAVRRPASDPFRISRFASGLAITVAGTREPPSGDRTRTTRASSTAKPPPVPCTVAEQTLGSAADAAANSIVANSPSARTVTGIAVTPSGRSVTAMLIGPAYPMRSRGTSTALVSPGAIATDRTSATRKG